MHKVLCDVIN